jgi:hypothetical protein
MGVEFLLAVSLIGVIVYQGWFIWMQKRHFEAVQKDLLNRVMSRNYETLVQADIAKAQAERPMSAEEIFEMQQERGIPV